MNEQIFRYLYGAQFLIFFIGQAVNATRAARRGGQDEYREKHHAAPARGAYAGHRRTLPLRAAPMYTAQAIFGLGQFVLAPANWLILVPGVLGFGVLMAVRIRHEEEVMLERFGDDYREYAQHTGRFLPRFKE